MRKLVWFVEVTAMFLAVCARSLARRWRRGVAG